MISRIASVQHGQANTTTYNDLLLLRRMTASENVEGTMPDIVLRVPL
jgi:hypothetical protein